MTCRGRVAACGGQRRGLPSRELGRAAFPGISGDPGMYLEGEAQTIAASQLDAWPDRTTSALRRIPGRSSMAGLLVSEEVLTMWNGCSTLARTLALRCSIHSRNRPPRCPAALCACRGAKRQPCHGAALVFLSLLDALTARITEGRGFVAMQQRLPALRGNGEITGFLQIDHCADARYDHPAIGKDILRRVAL